MQHVSQVSQLPFVTSLINYFCVQFLYSLYFVLIKTLKLCKAFFYFLQFWWSSDPEDPSDEPDYYWWVIEMDSLYFGMFHFPFSTCFDRDLMDLTTTTGPALLPVYLQGPVQGGSKFQSIPRPVLEVRSLAMWKSDPVERANPVANSADW